MPQLTLQRSRLVFLRRFLYYRRVTTLKRLQGLQQHFRIHQKSLLFRRANILLNSEEGNYDAVLMVKIQKKNHKILAQLLISKEKGKQKIIAIETHISFYHKEQELVNKLAKQIEVVFLLRKLLNILKKKYKTFAITPYPTRPKLLMKCTPV